ncbi:DNA-binding IclR family transcriptional regulator [Paraburkholderia sp. GAS448]|uniref:hypothetical protein n=1 Tax=Paraburkholderia sp. GAS448 TaxID=3035136 RepID=UPI003D1B16E5
MRISTIVTVERLLACIGAGERCTRAEIMRRLDAGLSSVQHVLNVCVAHGWLRRTPEGRHLVWWKPTPLDGAVATRPFADLCGYGEELQRLARLSMAARQRPPGQVIRYGVGWQ